MTWTPELIELLAMDARPVKLKKPPLVRTAA